jgi:hypothetical protein
LVIDEAAKLFLGSKHATEDVFDCLQGRIELLDKVMNHYAGYREVVVGEGEGLSEYNVFHIRIKSMYLRTAYSLALEKLGVVVPNEPKSTWMGCCDKAVIMVRAIGYEGVTSKTLMTWNKYFRDDAKFPHPNPYFANGIHPKPKPVLFELFPKASIDLSEFIIKHQDHFNVQMAVELFSNVMLPALDEEAKKLGNDSEEMELIGKKAGATDQIEIIWGRNKNK